MTLHPELESFTDADFDERVLRSELPVLVEFSAAWCPPCQVLAPVIAKLAADHAGQLRVGTLDVDRNGEIATRYAIHHLPTMLVFREGQIVLRVVGALPRARLDTLLRAHVLERAREDAAPAVDSGRPL